MMPYKQLVWHGHAKYNVVNTRMQESRVYKTDQGKLRAVNNVEISSSVSEFCSC